MGDAARAGSERWRVRDGIVAFVAANLFALGPLLGLRQLGWHLGDVGGVIGEALLVAIAILVARRRGPVRAADFGLGPVDRRAAARATARGWLALTAFLILYLPLARPASEMHHVHGVVGVLALLVVGFVAAPVGEEVLFRGLLFRAFRNGMPLVPAALLSTALFTADHALSGYSLAQLPPVFAMGAIACVIYERTQSLWPCIGLHAVLDGNFALANIGIGVGGLTLITLAILLARRDKDDQRPAKQATEATLPAEAARVTAQARARQWALVLAQAVPLAIDGILWPSDSAPGHQPVAETVDQAVLLAIIGVVLWLAIRDARATAYRRGTRWLTVFAAASAVALFGFAVYLIAIIYGTRAEWGAAIWVLGACVQLGALVAGTAPHFARRLRGTSAQAEPSPPVNDASR